MCSISFNFFLFSNSEERGDTTSRGAGITVQAARYSSEDAAQIVEYIQLVVQFSKRYQPYQKTLQILEGLKIDKEDQAALMRAQKIQVSEELISEVSGILFICIAVKFVKNRHIQLTVLVFVFMDRMTFKLNSSIFTDLLIIQ